jgi:low temperature requirement protein LtrA
MIILSGALLAVAAVLWLAGLLGPSACVYASLALTLFAAGMLPLGAARRVRRGGRA